jgi:hypothetical protein
VTDESPSARLGMLFPTVDRVDTADGSDAMVQATPVPRSALTLFGGFPQLRSYFLEWSYFLVQEIAVYCEITSLRAANVGSRESRVISRIGLISCYRKEL